MTSVERLGDNTVPPRWRHVSIGGADKRALAWLYYNYYKNGQAINDHFQPDWSRRESISPLGQEAMDELEKIIRNSSFHDFDDWYAKNLRQKISNQLNLIPTDSGPGDSPQYRAEFRIYNADLDPASLLEDIKFSSAMVQAAKQHANLVSYPPTPTRPIAVSEPAVREFLANLDRQGTGSLQPVPADRPVLEKPGSYYLYLLLAGVALNLYSLYVLMRNTPGAIDMIFSARAETLKASIDTSGGFTQAQPLLIGLIWLAIGKHMARFADLRSKKAWISLGLITVSVLLSVTLSLVKVARYEIMPLIFGMAIVGAIRNAMAK